MSALATDPARTNAVDGAMVLDRIESVGEQVTAARDGVTRLLGEFPRRYFPEHLGPARESAQTWIWWSFFVDVISPRSERRC